MRMACDSSGGLLATGGSDRKILVWDVDGGFCTHYFKGHKGLVTSLMFHPDANRLLVNWTHESILSICSSFLLLISYAQHSLNWCFGLLSLLSRLNIMPFSTLN